MKKNYSTFLFFLLPFLLTAQIPNLEIWEIQGDGQSSPYNNDFVITEQNIVTAIGDDFFFMQTPTNRSDQNEDTSDGIRVNYNNTITLEIGDIVNVEGYISELFGLTNFESNGVIVTIESNNAVLPAPILLNTDFPSESAIALRDLEKVEGMYVEINPAITTAPTNQFNETTIKAGNIRSFREPGIVYPAPVGLPEWDGNPEVFEFEPNGLGLDDQEELSAGMIINAKGVISYAFGEYQILPCLLYTSPSPRDRTRSRMPSSA